MKITTITDSFGNYRKKCRNQDPASFPVLDRVVKSDMQWKYLSIMDDVMRFSKYTKDLASVEGKVIVMVGDEEHHIVSLGLVGQEVMYTIMRMAWFFRYMKKGMPFNLYFPEDMDMVNIIQTAGKKADCFWSYPTDTYVHIKFPGICELTEVDNVPEAWRYIKAVGALPLRIRDLQDYAALFIQASHTYFGDIAKTLGGSKEMHAQIGDGLRFIASFIKGLENTEAEIIYVLNSVTKQNQSVLSVTTDQELACILSEEQGENDTSIFSEDASRLYHLNVAGIVTGFGMYMKAFPKAVSSGVPEHAKDRGHKHNVVSVGLTNKFPTQNRTMEPHYRHGSFITYSHERYTNMRGKTVWRQGAFVKQAADAHTVDDVYPEVTKETAEAV